MTPLAVRLRDLADRCRTKKLRATGGLLLSYRECAAVLALLDAAKAIEFTDWGNTEAFGCCYRLKVAGSALEKHP